MYPFIFLNSNLKKGLFGVDGIKKNNIYCIKIISYMYFNKGTFFTKKDHLLAAVLKTCDFSLKCRKMTDIITGPLSGGDTSSFFKLFSLLTITCFHFCTYIYCFPWYDGGWLETGIKVNHLFSISRALPFWIT